MGAILFIGKDNCILYLEFFLYGEEVFPINKIISEDHGFYIP